MALSSGQAELNSAAKDISEGIGVTTAMRELFGESRKATLSVDASACNGMLLRTGMARCRRRLAPNTLQMGRHTQWGGNQN